MIALDTNVLVYAHRRDSTWHEAAAGTVRGLGESGDPWAIAWPCIHEFLSVVTNRRIYEVPSTAEDAFNQIDIWLESQTLVFLSESGRHLETLRNLIRVSKVSGAATHDARVAAICIDHGVREIWTADRDFSKFRGLKAVNPLVH